MNAAAYGRARLAFLLGGTAAIALLAGQPARAISLNDLVNPTASADVAIDSTNQFPNVSLLSSGCTGTLINSRTIVTAAHCFFNGTTFDGGPTTTNPGLPIPSVSFAPTAGTANSNNTTITSIVRNNFIPPENPENDIAVISLATPVTSITPVTLINPSNIAVGALTTSATPIPTGGTPLTIVGYGGSGNGTQGCVNAGDGNRRMAATQLGAFAGQIPNAQANDTSSNQDFYLAEFRNPLSPNAPNSFGLTAPVPALQSGICPGDSGGPAFIQTAQGLVQIGELFGVFRFGMGDSHGGYGAISAWTPINVFLDWIAQNDPLREVTAAAGNFNWRNPAAWVDSVPGVASAVPNNTIGNVTDYQTGIARYYDVTLSNPGTVTLDMNPTIDTLAIAGAQSQLLLPAGFTLSTVLSTTLSAGTLTMSGGTLMSPEVGISGGLLTGNGTIMATGGNTGVCDTGVCNTGGTVMPVGTLSIQGIYTQSADGVLAYQVSPTSASGTLAVTSTANLGGVLAVTVTPGLYANSMPYPNIVTANPIFGQFAQVVLSSIFLPAEATYDPTSVDLTLNRIPFGAVPGLSTNQSAVTMPWRARTRQA